MHYRQNGRRPGELAAPQRNHYFYGKLLDEFHLQMEQTYFNRKRWLLNRLGLGSGVLCGLEVTVSDDGKTLRVAPGVAIDPLGREIIVPQAVSLDPWRKTDDCGGSAEELTRSEAHSMTICLAYRECDADYAPVLVSDCNKQDQCEPGTVIESYCFLVQEQMPEPLPARPLAAFCNALKQGQDSAERIRLLCEGLLSTGCDAPVDKTCVPLAAVRLLADGDGTIEVDANGEVDNCNYRPMVYSNPVLFDLILCLTERVDNCCRILILRLVSGDDQEAKPEGLLGDSLIVEVVDGDGNLVAGEIVTFQVRGGGGKVDPESVETDANGRAATQWRLGTKVGIQRVEASIASGSHVDFFATAVADPVEAMGLYYVSGDMQSAQVGAELVHPLVVEVRQGTAKVPNEVVTFRVIGGSGQVGLDANNLSDSITVPSDGNGKATLPVWFLGPSQGTNLVLASIASGAPSLYIFRATAVADPVEVKRLVYVTGDGQSAPAGQKVKDPLVVEVRQGNQLVQDEPVTFDMIEGNGLIGDGTNPVSISVPIDTLADGRAELPYWELGATAVQNRVRAYIASGTPDEYTFHATGQPVREDFLVVMGVEFVSSNGTKYSLASPDDWSAFPESDQVFQIRIAFNKALQPASLTPNPPMSPADALENSFWVENRTRISPNPLPGWVSVDSLDAHVAVCSLGSRGDQQFFQQGEHEVRLFGDKDNPLRTTIQAKDGSPLDGEPVSAWQSGPFSGEGNAGGDFVFHFTITA